MSRLIARLLLSLLMVPLAAVAYIVAFFVLDHMSPVYRYSYDEERWFALAGGVTFVLIIAYWLLLWGGVVKWNAARLMLTRRVGHCAAGAGAAVYASWPALGRQRPATVRSPPSSAASSRR